MHTDLFKSFFLGGFECSTHRRHDRRRLDVIRATRHDAFAAQDYRRLQRQGIRTARDGLRWHLIEADAGRYDFSSDVPMLRAARETGMQVIWDFLHYGSPDHVDVFGAAFVDGFAAFAREAIKRVSDVNEAPWVSPINEISFFSWAGGEGGIFGPFAHHRGHEMKRQLVRATIAAVAAMRDVNPAVRIVQVDPIINVVPRSESKDDVGNAEAYHSSQFEAWDMILGRAQPDLGGRDDLIDVIGANYYVLNQFIWGGGMIVPSDPRHRPVREMLHETYARYRRPIFVAETGIEDETRPAWLRYMCGEVFAAMAAGVPIEGICLYPIVNHPGWDDDRHCHNGLLDYPDRFGERAVFEPLAEEVRRQTGNLAALRAGRFAASQVGEVDLSALDSAAHVMRRRTDQSRTDQSRTEAQPVDAAVVSGGGSRKEGGAGRPRPSAHAAESRPPAGTS